MRTSKDHILTSHVGSLPRPDGLIAAYRAHETGEPIDEKAFEQTLRAAVAEVVHHQHSLGIDIPGDGEFGKPMGQRVNYGSWWRYSWQRLGGLKLDGPNLYDMAARRSGPGEVLLTSFGDRRDRRQFAAAYADPDSGITTGPRPPAPVCCAPIAYTGQQAIQTDIANFKEALKAAGVEEGFMSAVAPGSASRIGNEYYKTEEELLYACADAMREEYKAIVDAGFLVQIDDPRLVTYYIIHPEASIADCRKWAEVRVEALNHALRDIPPEKIRFHTCYGINMGPRIHDMELKDIVDIILKIRAGAYSFEAANPRHEHEWKVWKDVKLPDGKVLIPGVISHSTILVEHPELVAERIVRYAGVVGRENVIAGSDCGFATFAGSKEVHPSIVWAKFKALNDGARIASKELWGRN